MPLTTVFLSLILFTYESFFSYSLFLSFSLSHCLFYWLSFPPSHYLYLFVFSFPTTSFGLHDSFLLFTCIPVFCKSFFLGQLDSVLLFHNILFLLIAFSLASIFFCTYILHPVSNQTNLFLPNVLKKEGFIALSTLEKKKMFWCILCPRALYAHCTSQFNSTRSAKICVLPRKGAILFRTNFKLLSQRQRNK